MVLIKKWWVRLIFSMVCAAILSEAVFVMTDGSIRYNAFLAGLALYLILSIGYGFYLRNQKK